MSFRKPRISICVPSGITEVEKKAVEDAAYLAGAREVTIIEEPIAAAIGAGVDVSRPCGNMIVTRRRNHGCGCGSLLKRYCSKFFY